MASITLAQYRALPNRITAGAAERLLGAPNDRDIYVPRGLVTGTLPSGVPGSHVFWLDYRWRGHPHRYFQFIFREGRLIPHDHGRSILWR